MPAYRYCSAPRPPRSSPCTTSPAAAMRLLTLPRRGGQADPPTPGAHRPARTVPCTRGLQHPPSQAIERHLADDGQVLVFLNRRGYAPTLLCTACGWIAPCSECDARLTVHLCAARLRCHHCGADAPLPSALPAVRIRREAGRPGHRAHRRALAGAVSAAHRSRASIATSCAGAATWRSVVARMTLGRSAHPGRHADGDEGSRLPERHAGRGAERGPGTLQHRLPCARAARADHRPGRRPRGTRHSARAKC